MLRRIVAILSCFVALTAHGVINIWDGAPHHPKVEMTPYLVPGNNNPAIIICPGGSYFWHDINTEGHDVAIWLQQNGFSAFVLKYRTGGPMAFVTHYRLICRGTRFRN